MYPDDHLMTVWIKMCCISKTYGLFTYNHSGFEDRLMIACDKFLMIFYLFFQGKGNLSNASHCVCHSNFLSATKIQFLAVCQINWKCQIIWRIG